MQVVELIQISGDYTEEQLSDLREIFSEGYRGTIQVRDEEEGYCLVAFTFPRYGQPDRSIDGLRYIWVSEKDIAAS